MAMLAEPRRKQRIGLNPRGKFFTEDEDNRGRQMLMKLGWKTGEGLGATNQGMSEPLKPKVHTDSRGLGYDRKKDPWVAHNEEFEQLLKSLNTDSNDGSGKQEVTSGEEGGNPTNEALEKKSKGSRSRIHYQKFVKNKDLSKASTKDLSCIFGKALDETASVYSALNGDAEPEEESGQTTHFLGPGIGDSRQEIVSAGDEEKKKKRKKKRKDMDEENPVNDEPEGQIPEISEDPKDEVVCSKKKKNKRKSEAEAEEPVTPEPVEAQEEEEISKKKKKKKRSKDKSEEEISVETKDSLEESVSNSIPEETSTQEDLERKTKKKKRKQKNTHENEEAEEQPVEIPVPEHIQEYVSENDENSSSKKKKSKKRKQSDDAQVETEIVNDSTGQCEPSEQISKKKKKRKQESEETSASTPDSNEDSVDKSDPSSETVYKPAATDKIEKIGCLQFINRGSLTDYFASKMKSRGIANFQM